MGAGANAVSPYTVTPYVISYGTDVVGVVYKNTLKIVGK